MSESPTDQLAGATGRSLERAAFNINPGEWRIGTREPIATLLGSCVAVCFFDPDMRIGGMNHFLLPSRQATGHSDDEITLSGDYAMEILLNALLERGAKKSRLVAKAFGGGNIVSSIRTSSVGERNVDFARKWLELENIPLVAYDLGGPWPRKVVFLPESGDVYCRRIQPTQDQVQEAVAAEVEYERRLTSTKPAVKKVELF